MKNNGDTERFPCPKGCGRDFKSNSGAHAHAVHCKFAALVEEPVDEAAAAGEAKIKAEAEAMAEAAVAEAMAEAEAKIEDPAGVQPELTESEMAIYNRVAGIVGVQVGDEIAKLQGRVQESLIIGLPQMIETKVSEGIATFVESLRNPQPAAAGDPGTAVVDPSENGAGGKTTGLGDLLALGDQINAFLDSSVGKIIHKKFFSGGGTPKANVNQWRQGSNLAVRMLSANKSDAVATAQTIKEFAAPYKGKAGNDMIRGMLDIAEIYVPTVKGAPPAVVVPPEVQTP